LGARENVIADQATVFAYKMTDGRHTGRTCFENPYVRNT
jgi:hypothetical protein